MYLLSQTCDLGDFVRVATCSAIISPSVFPDISEMHLEEPVTNFRENLVKTFFGTLKGGEHYLPIF